MHLIPALCGRTRLTSQRGAVFLLGIYITSLLLLIIGGFALQRTMTESRAGQVSRDLQQAFYLAEGALDLALQRLRTESVPDGTYEVTTQTSRGSAISRYTITTQSAKVVDSSAQELTREITATGTTPSGISARAQMSVTEAGPLRGVWTEGPILMTVPWNSSVRTSAKADLRSALGTKAAIRLQQNISHEGVLQIAPAEGTTESYEYLAANSSGPWAIPIGSNLDDHPGVYLGAAPGPQVKTPPPSTTTEQPTVAPVTLSQQPVVSPYDPVRVCTPSVTPQLFGGTLRVDDGGPLDLRNTRGAGVPDGAIDLCVHHLFGDYTSPFYPNLVTNAPTTIYVTGPTPSSGSLVRVADLYASNPGGGTEQVGEGRFITTIPLIIPNGIKLFVTEIPPTGSPAGRVCLTPSRSRFSGSIYAPHSTVFLYGFESVGTEFQYLVAREIFFMDYGAPFLVGRFASGSQSSRTGNTVSITSWMSP